MVLSSHIAIGNNRIYTLLVNPIESDNRIKEHICSEDFEKRLYRKIQNLTLLLLTLLERELFIKYCEVKSRVLDGVPVPSLK